MISSLNIECGTCKAVYTLSIEELNITVLFKCSECGQYNIYIAGHVLTLDHDIMSNRDDRERHRHIVEVLQLWGCVFAGNVLKNVSRVININLEMDLQDAGGPDEIQEEPAGGPEIAGRKMLPSVKTAGVAPITDEEVRDFISIDLNLIDKKSYFNKIFGKGGRHKSEK